jgi:hypothetical protein
MKKGDLFPLADHYLSDQRFNSQSSKFIGYSEVINLKAQYTGEKRNPKKGEWYLSGSIIEAYQAKNDLNISFHIAKIIRIEKIVIENVIEILKD